MKLKEPRCGGENSRGIFANKRSKRKKKSSSNSAVIQFKFLERNICHENTRIKSLSKKMSKTKPKQIQSQRKSWIEAEERKDDEKKMKMKEKN